MRCDEFEQDLIDVAAGGASPPGLEAHLEGCPACRQRVADQRALLAGFEDELRGYLLAEPNPEVLDRIAFRLARREAASRRTFRALGVAAGVGAVLLAGVMARRSTVAVAPDPPATIAAVQRPHPGPAAPETRGPRPRSTRPVASAARRDSPSTVLGRSKARAPEVLVPPGEKEALHQFLAGLRGGALPPPPLLASATPLESPVAAPKPLEIPPLVSNPLSESAHRTPRSDS